MPTQAETLMHFDKLDQTGDILCPFCGDGDFDRLGLKQHLIQWCDAFKEIK